MARHRLSGAVVAVWTLVVLAGAVRCGKDKDDKKGGDEPPVKPPVTDPPGPLPTEWDGKTDWIGSSWGIVDE